MVDLKKLSEFAAEFFGVGHKYVSNSYSESIVIPLTPHSLFDDDNLSPILAHLALKEMEKREYKAMYYSLLIGRHIWKFANKGDDIHGGIVQEDENKFIALWSAVRSAINEKD